MGTEVAHAVLVVDDEAATRQNLSRHLEERGLTVFQAEKASGAISKIMRHPEVALVFTNSRLAGPMDGSDLVLWLRLNHPRIVVMIATSSLVRVESWKGQRVACTFIKPYKQDMVSDSILRVLGARARP